MSETNPFKSPNSTRADSSPVDPSKPDSEANAPELTIRVIVLGLILSVVMGAANVYVGLKAGMTVSASIPAAVMAMLVFRYLFRSNSILEANQVQTSASAGESLAAGIIFTMPALVMIGYWDNFDYWTITIVAFTGGLLGILFMIPMRKVFVVDNDELIYPEGVACASVLEAGTQVDGKSDDSGTSLILGGMLGGIFKLAGGFFGILLGTFEAAKIVGSRILYLGADVSPMLIAVGFIVRLNVALLIFIGGAISWLICIPIIGGADASLINAADPDQAKSAVDQAYGVWSSSARYIGVGAMVVGGFASLVSVFGGLVAAVKQIWNGIFDPQPEPDSKRDIPSWSILALGGLCTALLAYVNYSFTQDVTVTVVCTLAMLVLGFFFTAVASYIVGLVGNSNSPVSGMTITAVLVAGLMLYLMNYSGTDAMVATLGIAAIVCCVACTSGDVCNDLKTGSMVGASPFRQQIMQVLGVFVASFIMCPVLWALQGTEGGIGGKELPAPQAGLFASLAEGFFSDSNPLPWHLIAVGAGIGVVILIIDTILKYRKSSFRAYLMPIAVGMYLPFGLAIPILIGGIMAHFYSKGHPKEEHDRVLHRGVLFSSGVIAGEALTAVAIAIVLFSFGTKSMSLLEGQGTVLMVLTAGAFVAMIAAFAFLTKPSRDK
ncbi:MAG: oligopeptide transporter, OPT family [Planctomycetota bacterium]